MRNDNLGRKRKDLIEKSTSLIIKLDNKTIFKILDDNKIDYDPNAEIFDSRVTKELTNRIIDILKDL